MAIECPSCGSINIAIREAEKQLPVACHDPVTYLAIQHECQDCGEAGDFTGENDERIIKAREDATKESINVMLEELSKEGMKMTYMERVLGLPFKTINRWKGGDISAAGVSLVRIIHTFPWILGVADYGYNREVATGKLIEEGVKAFKEEYKKHYAGCNFAAYLGDMSHKIEMEFHLKVPLPPQPKLTIVEIR